MALIDFFERVCVALDNNEYTISIFLDLYKAFDMVNHDILLLKLHIYTILQTDNNAFILIIVNLTQEHCHAVWPKAQSWVLYYFLYINDLSTVSGTIFPILFVDDTNLSLSDKNLQALLDKANKSLKDY